MLWLIFLFVFQCLGNSSACPPPALLTPDIASTRWSQRCPQCGFGMNLRLDQVNRSRNCRCQADSVFSAQDLHWANPVFPSFPRKLRTTVVPCPKISPPQKDFVAESSQTAGSSYSSAELEISSEPTFPKKIDIDSDKLLSSVYAKTQKAQSVCGDFHALTSAKRRLLRCSDAQIRKPDRLATPYLEYSYSRRLSAGCTVDSYATALQGFPTMLNRFRLGNCTPIATSAMLADGNTKKISIYEPKLLSP